MKNTSAGYMASGLFTGLVLSHVSATEPAWAFFLVPAVVCFVTALVIDHS